MNNIHAISRRQFLVCGAVAVSGSWMVTNRGLGETANPDSREIITDPHFEHGFRLIEPAPGKRVVYGTWPEARPDTPPAWDLDQWSSRFPLKSGIARKLQDGGRESENDGKRIVLAPRHKQHADLILDARGGNEYRGRARRDGEPWPHLLVEQQFVHPPRLDQLKKLQLRLECRLLHSRRIDSPDYSPERHAAQFQLFLQIQNLNPASSGHGKLLWFGVPLYDDRHRFVPEYAARDTGGTNMFIFTVDGRSVSSECTHDPHWISADLDLLPHIRRGLDAARRRGFLTESQKDSDYKVSGMNLGLFDVAMQIRNLSLRADQI
jgi:hypothetical protein